MKTSVKTKEEQDELSEILDSIGDVSIVTKKDAGKSYYSDLAQGIYQVAKELLNRYHGVVSLVDVFYIFNEKRKISLISSQEMLKAC
mmetsp:Transcript_17224/g.15109  ORF Transcript_17224/g.15109 Transcript_17224/m.15109 type:complete len:87 (+) Transcript_17224:575-835(+)